MAKKELFTLIGSALRRGLPFIKTLKEAAVKVSGNTPMTNGAPAPMVNWWQILVKFKMELIAVSVSIWILAFAMKKLGITLDDIVELGGVLHDFVK